MGCNFELTYLKFLETNLCKITMIITGYSLKFFKNNFKKIETHFRKNLKIVTNINKYWLIRNVPNLHATET